KQKSPLGQSLAADGDPGDTGTVTIIRPPCHETTFGATSVPPGMACRYRFTCERQAGTWPTLAEATWADVPSTRPIRTRATPNERSLTNGFIPPPSSCDRSPIHRQACAGPRPG